MRKKRILTITGLVFLGLTLLLVLGGILLYSFTPVIDNAILALVNRLGQDNIHLSYKNLSGNLFNRIRVDEMTLTFGSDSLTADRIELNYSLLDVVRGDYRVDDVDIEGPRLTLDITPDSTAQDTAAFSINALLDKLNPASLPRLEIGNLNLTDGQVKLTNGEKTEILDQIGLEMAGFLKPDSVRLEPVTLKARWQNRDITLDPLRISLTGNERKLRLNRLSANGGKHRLHAHGEVDFEPESRVTLWLDTLNLNVPELGRQVPDFPFKEGQLALSGEVAGNDSGLSGKLQASGKMDYLTLRELRSDFALVGEGYELDNFHLASNVGHVNGKVRLFPKGENTVDVTVNKLDLQAAQLSNDPLLLNGKVDFTFRGFSLDTFRGRGHLSLRNTVVGPARIDRVWLGVYSDGERINFAEDSRVEIAPGSQFRVGGYVTRDLVADLHMVTEDNRLDSLARRLGIENAGGSGDLDLKLSGKLSDPNLEGNLEIDSLYYQDNVIYGIHGKADLSRLATSRRGMFDLEVATGYLGDVFLTSGEMRLTFSKDRIVLNPLQFYTEENSVFCRGYVRMLDNYIYVSLPDLNMKFREYTITNQEALQLHVDQDSLVVEQFKMITSDKGEISAEGFVAFNGESHLIAEIEGLPLAPVDQYLYLDYKLDGMLSRANLFLGGKLDNPEVELGFTVDSLSLDNHYLGILSSDMTLSDHRFNLNNLSFDSPTGGYFSLNGNLDLMLGSEGDSAKARLVDEPLNLSMVFSDLRIQDYAFLYDVNYPLKGTFEGRIDLIGDIDRPRGTINLTGSDLQYQDYIFPSIAIEDGKMTHQEIDIPKALIDFSNTEIRASFKKPISWNPDAPEKLMEDKTFSAEAFVEE
ncbi:MAG TPA: hypothetical protein PKV71_05985, partial [Calditrichia bacterium]|nr:hypothetical protein [Calditrichia bacterium]